MLEELINIDSSIFRWINGHHHPVLDQLMYFASGKISWAPLYLLLLIGIYKKYDLKTFLFSLLATVILITLCDQISVKAFKNVFERLRPSWGLNEVRLLTGCGGKFGFVSSHATNVFGLATFMSLLMGKHYKGLTICLFFWASLVGYSRIYLGRHYLGDVIGGAILGFIIGLVVYRFFHHLWLRKL